MTTILLGHSGFIGKSISKIFKDSKNDLIEISSKEINFILDNSVNSLKSIFSKDVSVIMCMGIKKQYGDNIDNWIKNEIILKNFIKSLIKNPPKHVIYFSSASIYGEDTKHKGLISEFTSVSLRSLYGISKFNGENILRKICDDYNISLVCLRPPLIYGHQDLSIGYGPTLFADNSIKKEKVNIWGDGKEKREFIFVDDLAYLCEEILNKKITGILNTVSGISYSYKNILYELEKILGYKIQVVEKKRTKEKVDHIFSTKLHDSLLPDFKYTSLIDGLKNICYEFKKNKK